MRLISADEFNMNDEATVTMPVGVSGTFIRSFDASRLSALCDLSLDFSNLTARKRRIEEALRNCNDPVWLARFAERVGPSNFKASLVQRASALEAELAELLPKWEVLQNELQHLDPAIPQSIEVHSVAAPKRSGPSGTRRAIRHGNLVAKRMGVIRKYKDQSHLQICRELDEALQDQTRAVPVPSTWVRDFGVKSYVGAYRIPACRPRVHRLISGAKS